MLAAALLLNGNPSDAQEPSASGVESVRVQRLEVVTEKSEIYSNAVAALTWTWDVSDGAADMNEAVELENGLAALSGFEVHLQVRQMAPNGDLMPPREAPFNGNAPGEPEYYVGPHERRFSVPLPHDGEWCLAVRAVDQTSQLANASVNAGPWSTEEGTQTLTCVMIEPKQMLEHRAPKYEAEGYLKDPGRYYDTDGAVAGPTESLDGKAGDVATGVDEWYDKAGRWPGNKIIGKTRDGEFLEYTVDKPAGIYEIAVQVASPPVGAVTPAGALVQVGHIEVNTVVGTGADAVDTAVGGPVHPPRFGWREWRLVPVGEVELPGGPTTIRVSFHGAGNINFDGFEVREPLQKSSGSVDVPGILVAPGEDLQALIDQNSGGQTYLFEGGLVYENIHDISPKDGDRFLGVPQEETDDLPIFDGSGQTQLSAFATYVEFNPADLVGALGAQLDPSNPAHAAEIASNRRERLKDEITAAPANIVIRDIVFRNYAPGNFRGVIHGVNYLPAQVDVGLPAWPDSFGAPLAWQVSNVTVDNTRGDGIYVGSAFELTDVVVSRSSRLGIGGVGTEGVSIRRGEISENSFGLRYPPDSENLDDGLWGHSGGLKITRSKDLLVQGVTVRGNQGPGLWLDIGNQDARLLENHVVDNLATGIHYEISFDGEIVGNRIVRNASLGTKVRTGIDNKAHAGIYSSTSRETIVRNNYISGSPTGVMFFDGSAGPDGRTVKDLDKIAPALLPGGVNEFSGAGGTAAGNVVCYSRFNGVDATEDSFESVGFSAATFKENSYYNPTHAHEFFWNRSNPRLSLSRWSEANDGDEGTKASACQIPLTCSVSGDTLTWRNVGQSKYWIYRSLDGENFAWIGRTLGAPSFVDPSPQPGALYQVHYAGVSRSLCTSSGPEVVVQAESYRVTNTYPKDTTPGNAGTATMFTDDVDVWTNPNDSSQFAVGTIRAGEQLTYWVTVPEDGTYEFNASTASVIPDGGRLTIRVNGAPVTNPGDEVKQVAIAGTGGWWNFADTTIGSMSLNGGQRYNVTLQWFADIVEPGEDAPAPDAEIKLSNMDSFTLTKVS